MAFTYDATLATNRDRVRFLLQDTTNTTARPNLLDDGEIAWVLTTEANIYMAAAICADALASRFRGLKSKTVGGLSLSWAVESWEALAKKLRARGSSHQVLSAGGVLKDDRDAIWQDSDLIRPSFFADIHQDAGQLPPARGADLTEEELP